MNNPEFEASSSQNSMIDVMNLPEQQRQLASLIIHHQKVSLSQAAVHLNLTEELVQEHLQNLIFQGFIQEVNDSEIVYYQPCFSTQKKSKLNQNIWDKLGK